MSGNCGQSSFTGTATDIVENQIDAFTAKGDVAFSTALAALNAISDSFETTVSAGLNLTPEADKKTEEDLPDYMRPTPEPETPDLSWTPPDSLPIPPDYVVDYDDYFKGLSRPTYRVDPPNLQYPTQPNRALPDQPDDPEPLQVPTYPDAPSLDYPTLSALRSIQLPYLNPPNLAAVEALITQLRNEVPEAPELPPDIDFMGLAEQLFAQNKSEVADVLTGLVGRISTMLEGGTGLPAAVALALRNRAFQAEDKLAFQMEQTAIADWLSRGFTLPGGALEVKLAEVRNKNRDKQAELNLNLWLEETKLEIENLRFAVQQGIAYEGMWKDALLKLLGVCGDWASKQVDVQLRLVDAAIAIFKAKADLWQVQFSTIKDQIQIELAKVEIYKAELDGQRLVSELNRLDVEVYRARLDALQTRVSVYKTQVEGANALLQAELGKLEYAAKRIQIYTAEISAWKTEWEAYETATRGELGKVELYKGMVQGFSAQVEAYAKNVEAARSQASLQLESLNSRLKAWEARAEKYREEIRAEAVRIGSLAQVYETEMRGYALRHDAEKTYVETEMGKLQYTLSVDKFNADVYLKEAELEQTKTLQLTKIAQDSLDAVARTSAQLAGSAMSAMNVGALLSASNSNSDSTGCTTSYSYDMTA